MKKTLIALLLISLVPLTGCSSSITAISLKDGKNNNKKAIPYYLPQSYLLITKEFSHLGTKTTKKEKQAEKDSGKEKKGNVKPEAEQRPKPSSPENSTTTEPVSVTVNGYTYKIIYLPNPEEKYGLIYKTGSGESDLLFTLKDGWMFTGLNLKSDTQIDETITAMSSLLGSIAKIAEPLLQFRIDREPKPKPEPAIWLFRMTFGEDEISFDRVSLDFKLEASEKLPCPK